MKNNVAEIRYSKKMSLSSLAKLSGASKSYISKIENGQQNPTVPYAYAICRVLGYSIYEIFPDQPITKKG